MNRTDDSVLIPFHYPDSNTGLCWCPNCTLSTYINVHFQSLSETKLTTTSADAKPPAYSQTPENNNTTSTTGVPVADATSSTSWPQSVLSAETIHWIRQELRECPMYSCFGFCYYGDHCLLDHHQDEELSRVSTPQKRKSGETLRDLGCRHVVAEDGDIPYSSSSSSNCEKGESSSATGQGEEQGGFQAGQLWWVPPEYRTEILSSISSSPSSWLLYALVDDTPSSASAGLNSSTKTNGFSRTVLQYEKMWRQLLFPPDTLEEGNTDSHFSFVVTKIENFIEQLLNYLVQFGEEEALVVEDGISFSRGNTPRRSKKDKSSSSKSCSPRSMSLQEEEFKEEKLVVVENPHDDHNRLHLPPSCHVCGYSGTTWSHISKVAETAFFRSCPRCGLSSFYPEMNYLARAMALVSDVKAGTLHIPSSSSSSSVGIAAAGASSFSYEPHLFYRELVAKFRKTMPWNLKVPLSYECHRLATLKFGWSAISSRELEEALSTIVRSGPSTLKRVWKVEESGVEEKTTLSSGEILRGEVEQEQRVNLPPVTYRVMSLGCGSGYVEHCLSLAQKRMMMRHKTTTGSQTSVSWEVLAVDYVLPKPWRHHEFLLSNDSSSFERKPTTGVRYSVPVLEGGPDLLEKDANLFFSAPPISAEQIEFKSENARGAVPSATATAKTSSGSVVVPILFLCWPPFASVDNPASTMASDALKLFTEQVAARRRKSSCPRSSSLSSSTSPPVQKGDEAYVIYVGDISSTGDAEFHHLLREKWCPVRGYTTRHEIEEKWNPIEMGLVYAGNDSIGVYVPREPPL